jgi:hypothetical protein
MEKTNKNYSLVVYIIILLIIIVIVYEYNVNFFKYSYVYEKNIYSEKNFNDILLLCNSINTEDMVLDPKAINRLMYEFKPGIIESLLFNKKFIKKIRELTGNYNLYPCLDVPIEYRKYSIGSSMNWHSDTKILKDQYQYECVLTLTNTSDSLTIMNRILYNDEISSEPNSLMIVRAHGILHKVTETTKGERTILKFVFYEKIK